MYVYLRVYVQDTIGVVGTLIGESCHTYTCHVTHTRVMQHPLYAHTRIPRVTSTSCAESSGTDVAPGDHRTREHGAGRGTAQ